MPVGGEEDRKPNPVYHFYFPLSIPTGSKSEWNRFRERED